ncbi:hypothetical protein A1353_08635 [Methylomonas methanica]|uniref:Uncharacterized protein n=1 Tax=Methylomonas methanica TaxID=421 RepID=A0A177MMD2_METMH|nr:hypothetical protein A1353_08635 [Methylomonas methanica]
MGPIIAWDLLNIVLVTNFRNDSTGNSAFLFLLLLAFKHSHLIPQGLAATSDKPNLIQQLWHFLCCLNFVIK